METPGASGFSVRSDGEVVVGVYPEELNESRLKGNILNGGKSEISVKFRFRTVQETLDVSIPETQELHIRKTGFRDIITGDFVLMINGREAGTFRDWESFYRNFSIIRDFQMGKTLASGESLEIRYRIEIVYKKFVAPLNLLYLIPGKFITRGKWIDLQSGSEM